MSSLFGRDRAEIAPGAVHVPGWLTLEQQRELVEACRDWARGPAPMRHTKLPSGGVMSVQTVCLGWHWLPYRYTPHRRRRRRRAGHAVPRLAGRARAARRSRTHTATPRRGYTPGHRADQLLRRPAPGWACTRTRTSAADAPVVSLSIGDACVFRFGNTETRGKPYTDVELRSGDLFVFGGPSRFAYHGVPKTPGTGDPATGLATGRLNITMRETGLS